jgi:hypothetical protein
MKLPGRGTWKNEGRDKTGRRGGIKEWVKSRK